MNDSERDELLIEVRGDVKTLLAAKGDHETRLRSLEVTKNRQAGMLYVLSTAIGGLWAYFIGTK